MCGFLINNIDLTVIPSSSLLSRGPDQYGEIVLNGLRLRHYRLSIVGLDSGLQPSQSQKSVLLFNGEIYNFKELARDYSLSTQALESDTYCLHELIDKIGLINALNSLKGHFAYFYFDSVTDKAYFGRDQMGVKPLYFYIQENGLIITSDIQTVVNNSNASICQEAALEAIIFGGHTGENTLYEEIKSALPGAIYEYNGECKTIEIFDFLSEKTDQNLIEANLEQVIVESIRLQSDLEVLGVCMVSSGIDSRILKSELQVEDNLYFVTAKSKDFNLLEEDINNDGDTVALDISVESSTINFIAMLKAYGTVPAHNNYFTSCLMYNKLRNYGLFSSPVKVALTGEGADEYFGGYGRYRTLARYLAGEDSEWINVLKLVSNSWLFLMNSRINHQSLFWLKSRGVDIDKIIQRHIKPLKRIDMFSPPSIALLSRYDVQTNLKYGLHKQDVAGMLSSVEVRVPFVIQDIHKLGKDGDLASSSGSISKLYLREIAVKRGIRQNKKIGFPASLDAFIDRDIVLSKKVSNLLKFTNDKNIELPKDIAEGVYMLDLLISQ